MGVEQILGRKVEQAIIQAHTRFCVEDQTAGMQLITDFQKLSTPLEQFMSKLINRAQKVKTTLTNKEKVSILA